MIALLVAVGLSVTLALSLEFSGFSKQSDTSGAGAEIALATGRLESAVRDMVEGDDASARPRAEARRAEIKGLFDRAAAADRETVAGLRNALDAYWEGVEKIAAARSERARAGETMAEAVRTTRESLDTFRPAGGADSTAMAYDISVAIAEARDRIERAIVRRDPGELVPAGEALEAARSRVGEMNRYLWVQGTQKTRDRLTQALDDAARARDAVQASLAREAAVRADTLAPNAARLLDGAAAIRSTADLAAERVRGDLSRGAWAIVRVGLIAAAIVLLLGLCAMGWAFRAVVRPLGSLAVAAERLSGTPTAGEGDEVARAAAAVRALQVVETERREHHARILEERDEFLARERRAEIETAAKNEFLIGLGREIADPLNDIAGRAEALMVRMHREGMGDTAGDAEMIQWSAERLSRRLESVVEYARIQIGDLVVNVETIDIAALAAEVRERCVPAADMNGDTLRVVARPEVGSMRSDFDKLSRILVNLLDNACRNTRDGDVSLTVERVSDGDGDRIRFVVRDTGVGFPPEEAERLFLPFARGDQSSGEEGIGLGLTLVAHYTEALGGTVELASRPGEGTRVTVDLPAVPSPALVDASSRT